MSVTVSLGRPFENQECNNSRPHKDLVVPHSQACCPALPPGCAQGLPPFLSTVVAKLDPRRAVSAPGSEAERAETTERWSLRCRWTCALKNKHNPVDGGSKGGMKKRDINDGVPGNGKVEHVEVLPHCQSFPVVGPPSRSVCVLVPCAPFAFSQFRHMFLCRLP